MHKVKTRKYALVSIFGVLLIMLMGCSGGGDTTAKPTPTTPDVKYVDYDLKIPAEALNSPEVGPLPGDTKLHVLVTFKANQDELKKLKDLKQKSDQNIDLSQEANKIGITDAQYAKIKSYLGVDGVNLKLDTTHTSMTIDSKASLLETLLQTTFVKHKLKDGRVFFAPKTAPKIPDFMKDRIVAITGLDNYSKPPTSKATFKQLEQTSFKSSSNANDPTCEVNDPRVVNWKQVAHAYGLDSLWQQGFTGKGMVINLVELEGFDKTSVQKYFNCVGYKGNLKVINVDNEPNPKDAVGESLLDIEMIAGLAPDIDINVYQGVDEYGTGSWETFNNILSQIANDNAKKHAPSMVSISWGSGEQELYEEVFNSMSAKMQMLTEAEHMTVFAASGDCGAFQSMEWNKLDVNYPSSDPYATAVGGTLLKTDAQGNRVGETVWQDATDKTKCNNAWGSGGGLSTNFNQPAFTAVPGMQNKYSDKHRQVPDIAAVATNLPIYQDGGWYISGGTSAATPIWATALSLINQAMISKAKVYGYSTDLFYEIAAGKQDPSGPSYFDVTQGDNNYYPATQGWDYSTGLGAPNARNFYLTFAGLVAENP
ncbi:S53 family peptidase [Ktedonospora formicarum]|uniref:Kumamolisin n=1 Tax=Ktedonospora formicarum TaxID=2778364 RepID=A0A8J3MWT0_9CHLR|nr:S53 family peptidase [Ktedonospora formicarum]GHO49301.1 kumamolisin [Ktedonospora formicarum]